MFRKIIDTLEKSANTAFVIKDKPYSYKEFGILVKRYYHFLDQHPEIKLIGIVMHNDLQTYAFIIATLLSNCGYVILNLAHPIDRNALIASEAGLEHVVSSVAEDVKSLPDFLSFINLDEITTPNNDVTFQQLDPNSTAYILFTSGSTGNPKGVKITKKNLDAFLYSFFHTQLELDETDHVLQMFDLTFDASILMLLPSLCAGATIYTTDPSRLKIIEIARLLTTYPLTFVFLVPSVVSLLRAYVQYIHVPSLKTLVIGAEPVTKTLIDIIRPSIPNATLWCIYGPTETTVIVMMHKMDENLDNELYNDIIPIGKAMPRVKLLVMDEDEIVTEIGRKGELYIAGDQVTEGYINDEAKNKASFRYINYEGKMERFYASGDIVYLNKYGNYAYCARKDHQVKIQGHRIELNEIEFHARVITGRMSIAISKEIDGNPQLYLFVENYSGKDETIVNYLDQKLPPYMVPKNIIHLQQFPVNANDKIDRIKLSEYIQGN